MFAELSEDRNPVHLDAEFAAKTMCVQSRKRFSRLSATNSELGHLQTLFKWKLLNRPLPSSLPSILTPH